MPVYCGNLKKNLPYNKLYLGDVLKYKVQKDIIFTSSPTPTSWNVITAGKEYQASNEYGNWKISAWLQAEVYSTVSNNVLTNAFDGSFSASYCFSTVKNLGKASPYNRVEVTLECDKLIKPETIIVYGYFSTSSYLTGFNPETNSWETLATLTNSSQTAITINTTNFYSKFKVVAYIYSTSNTTVKLYEFQIKSGIIKG